MVTKQDLPRCRQKGTKMAVKVYVDVMFIINFIMDYILLQITALFIRRHPHPIKLISASIVGAIYATFVFFSSLGTLILFCGCLLTSCWMIIIAFGVNNVIHIIKNLAVFYLTSFVASGVSFAFLLAENGRGKLNLIIGNGVFYSDLNAYTMLAVFFIVITVVHISCGYLKKQRINSQFLYEVTIEKNGKQVTDTALFDTGNFLKDPISQTGIIIAEWQSVSALFSGKSLDSAVAEYTKDFSYIPCRGINGVTGMFAFRPDKIFSDKLTSDAPVLVGITATPLDVDGTFRMILPNDFQISNKAERM